ncbi:unnamed protein product [Prorocentrum cordatum]|uniref:ISXO2-like transposase domain-containing protein n=1 Tax=Prorocentrum cordatum TaxID=2364126 RepID=A0ABN9VIV3_9DINO|nr:unnamed protein product [Polarella glacialis]
MAVYKDWADFQATVKEIKGRARSEFLEKVKFASVENASPLPNTEARRAFAFAQTVGLAPKEYNCPTCEHPYTIEHNAESDRAGRLRWIGPRYSDGCWACNGDKVTASNFSFFQNTRMYHWMDKLDCLVMWLADYRHKTIVMELSNVNHQSVDSWISKFRETAGDWYDAVSPQASKKLFADKGPNKVAKPSASRPAAMKTAPKSSKKTATKRAPAKSTKAKKPVGRKFAKQVKKTINKRVLIADESFLNKRKPGKLNKCARPQKDQLWIWGAVLQGKSRTHFLFRILKHPDEAANGKPRGHKEMLENISLVNLQKGDTFVSDKWAATISAVKALRRSRGLTVNTLPHEMVNHDASEIVNERGFSTNAIEAKWSALKRRVRSKYGGRLPSHSNREKWRCIVNEFQARCLLSADHSLFEDHYYYVPLLAGIKMFAAA